MNQICRLCLTVSENMTCKLGEDTKILDKLSCLNVQISFNESLPTFVCYLCSKTLEDILNYKEKIIRNQSLLIKQLNSGINLDDFYSGLKYKENNLKTEIDIDTDDGLDQSVYYESEPMNNAKRNQTDDKDKISSKLYKDNDNIKSIVLIKHTNGNKTTQERKIPERLKKENRPNIKKRITILNKKIKAKNTCETKDNNTIIELKSNIELNSKAEENMSEEISINMKHTDFNEAEVNNEDLHFIKEEIDVKVKYSKCLTCFQYLDSNSELIKHYRTVHNNIDKENAKTDLVPNNSDNESKEIVTPNKSGRPYNCKVCGRTFTSVYAIIRHARAHSDFSLSCSHGCGYSTAYRGALRDHEKRHEKDFRYKCSTCGAGFHVRTWHDQHQNLHKKVKPFVCDLCGVAFHMNRYLSAHRSAVHAASLAGEKRFVCPHCDVSFDNTRNFRTHLEEHRGKKKFLCALCGKECSSGEQLKYHNNSHLGLKPFACSVCNKRFAKKYNLSVHLRAHSGEKYLCQQCGKHFAQRSTLLRHARKCHPESKECQNQAESNVNK